MSVVSYVETRRATRFDIEVEEGTDLRFPITITGVNATGYTVNMQVRDSSGNDTVLMELSTTNGKISVSDGKITLIFLPADTTDKDWSYGIYDLVMTDLAGKKTRILEGSFYIEEGVTR